MMFRSKKPKINPDTTDTLIGEGTVFEGKIRSEAGIRVEGQIIGDIECSGDVTIGEGGSARSNITARNVVLAGVVHGNVTAQGQLTIRASGQLYGNLTAQQLNIEAGAVFQGTSKMSAKEQPAAEKKAEKTDKEPAVGNSADNMLKAW